MPRYLRSVLLILTLVSGPELARAADKLPKTAQPQPFAVQTTGFVTIAGVVAPRLAWIRPGERITADPEGGAHVLLQPRVVVMVMGLGTATRADTSFVSMKSDARFALFSVRSGAFTFEVPANATFPDGIKVNVGITTITLAECRGIISVQGDTITCAVADGTALISPVNTDVASFSVEANQVARWKLRSMPTTTVAFQMRDYLPTVGMNPKTAKAVKRAIGTAGWSTGTVTSTKPLGVSGFIHFGVLVGLFLYLGKIVQPRTGGKGLIPIVIFVGVEYFQALSRFWLNVNGIWFAVGPFLLGLLILRWSYDEDQYGRSPLPPMKFILSHLGRYVALVAATNAMSVGLAYYYGPHPHSYLREMRTVFNWTGPSPHGHFAVAVPRTLLMELAAAAVPAIIYLLM
jgi:hypothetical protein